MFIGLYSLSHVISLVTAVLKKVASFLPTLCKTFYSLKAFILESEKDKLDCKGLSLLFCILAPNKLIH